MHPEADHRRRFKRCNSRTRVDGSGARLSHSHDRCLILSIPLIIANTQGLTHGSGTFVACDYIKCLQRLAAHRSCQRPTTLGKLHVQEVFVVKIDYGNYLGVPGVMRCLSGTLHTTALPHLRSQLLGPRLEIRGYSKATEFLPRTSKFSPPTTGNHTGSKERPDLYIRLWGNSFRFLKQVFLARVVR